MTELERQRRHLEQTARRDGRGQGDDRHHEQLAQPHGGMLDPGRVDAQHEHVHVAALVDDRDRVARRLPRDVIEQDPSRRSGERMVHPRGGRSPLERR
jgi:hypothetical protein